MKEHISIILKLSNICNLKCKHCYEGKSLQENSNTEIMSLSILEQVFNMAQSNYKYVTYIWFGGEPLICGINYFQKAISLQKIYQRDNIISNRIQTNATLLTEAFADLFHKENFAVSVSYDGQFNDFLRQETEKTLAGIYEIKKAGDNCGIISTIHAKNVLKQIDMYEHIKELGCFMQFNPIFPVGTAKENTDYLLDIDTYVHETMCLFHYWCQDASAIPITNFIQNIRLILGLPGISCNNVGCFYHWLCIEPNGDITPCSRFSPNQYTLCSINEIESFESVFLLQSYSDIVKQAVKRRIHCRKFCNIYSLCNGGCNSAAANEVGLANSEFQQCKITKQLLPQLIKKLDVIRTNKKTPNRIISDLLI